MAKFTVSIEGFREAQGFFLEVTVTTPPGTTGADQQVIVARIMKRIARLAVKSGMSGEQFIKGSKVRQLTGDVFHLRCSYTDPDFPKVVEESIASIVSIDSPDEPKIN